MGDVIPPWTPPQEVALEGAGGTLSFGLGGDGLQRYSGVGRKDRHW